jgi:hypothetical protein
MNRETKAHLVEITVVVAILVAVVVMSGLVIVSAVAAR